MAKKSLIRFALTSDFLYDYSAFFSSSFFASAGVVSVLASSATGAVSLAGSSTTSVFSSTGSSTKSS